MAELIRSPLMQNDSRLSEHPHIASAGCLWRVLVHIAEIEAKDAFVDQALLALYEEAVSIGAMETDCYVLDHARVGQLGLDYMGIDKTLVYLFREAIDESITSSWRHPHYRHYEANYFIRHYGTPSSEGGLIGHFVLGWPDHSTRWDPYFPGCPVHGERSFRSYYVGEEK